MEKLSTDVLVIGAGVIGLAIAEKISQTQAVILVEKNAKFGQETSSRNSEVIHSGIYYPSDSLKTKLCIEGRELLYAFCEKYKVPFRKTGKLVVGTQSGDLEYLEKLHKHIESLGLPVEKKSGKTISQWEPFVEAMFGLFLPETGIVNSHVLMEVLEGLIKKNDGVVAYHHRLISVEKKTDKFTVLIQNQETQFEIDCDAVVNCGGLLAPKISNQALSSTSYEHRYCRGRYFSLNATYQNKFKYLVYPTPVKDGLGVHVTIDLEGNARLGPDTDWCEAPAQDDFSKIYDCDWDALAPSFVAAAARYLKRLSINEVQPGMIGIRPKLFIDGKASPDFLIENKNGFIHCLGVESPGLTSSFSIAKKVRESL